MNFKIYEDKYYSVSSDTFSYYVENKGKVIFKGKTYKNPDNDYCYINISKICRDWISNQLPDFREFSNQTVYQEDAYQVFDLYTYYINESASGDTEVIPVLLETYGVLFDFDYSTPWSGQTCTLSNPINGRMDSRMKLFYSVFKDTSGSTINVQTYPYNAEIQDDTA